MDLLGRLRLTIPKVSAKIRTAGADKMAARIFYRINGAKIVLGRARIADRSTTENGAAGSTTDRGAASRALDRATSRAVSHIGALSSAPKTANDMRQKPADSRIRPSA